jgi:hypothetical protein
MEQFKVTITGVTPLLHHGDDVKWRDNIKRLLMEPEHAKNSVKGDDRSPAFTWIGNLYRYAGKAVVPADNLMTMLREGGKKCPTGNKSETFGRLTQSGLVVDQAAWPITVNGAVVDVSGIESLMDVADFEAHEAWATARGFELFVKAAKIGKAKHVRVRPRFNIWEASGTVTVFEPKITQTAFQRILDVAGQYCGIGDWRPSAPTAPGQFGRFTAKVARA